MGVEVRKIETEFNETGVGQSNRTDVNYELGAEIDGAWVPFARVPGNTVDALVTRAREAASSSETASTSETGAESGGQQMTDVAPTPAPQEQAAQSEQTAL